MILSYLFMISSLSWKGRSFLWQFKFGVNSNSLKIYHVTACQILHSFTLLKSLFLSVRKHNFFTDPLRFTFPGKKKKNTEPLYYKHFLIQSHSDAYQIKFQANRIFTKDLSLINFDLEILFFSKNYFSMSGFFWTKSGFFEHNGIMT